MADCSHLETKKVHDGIGFKITCVGCDLVLGYSCSQCREREMSSTEIYDHRVWSHGWGKEDN